MANRGIHMSGAEQETVERFKTQTWSPVSTLSIPCYGEKTCEWAEVCERMRKRGHGWGRVSSIEEIHGN